MDDPASKDQPGQDEAHIAKETQHHIGHPGADDATEIGYRTADAGGRPTRVRVVVTEQRQQQVDCHRRRGQQHGFTQAAFQTRWPFGNRVRFGF